MMMKKLLLMGAVAAVGAAVARVLRARQDAWIDAPPAVPQRIPAETLEVRTELPPEPERETQPEPQEERHALRPSPMPRDRPVWTPPSQGRSSGKHAAHEKDENDADG